MTATVAASEPHLTDVAFAALLAKITGERGVPCAGYKPSCLRRRVQVRLRATGTPSFAQYAALLDQTPGEWARLLDALTVNVTGFFRDPEVFVRLRESVIATLPRNASGIVTSWSAGCSTGEEAWTLAMLLANAHGVDATRVLATDVDAACLARAEAASYDRAAVDHVPHELRHRWWVGTDPVCVSDPLRERVTFARRDLLTQSPPATSLALITCRNVIIYFARDAQQDLLSQFAEALAIGGVLVLGKVESLSGPAASRFRAIDARERIYRRVA